MLIIGVISAIAAPRLAQASARQRLEAAANRVDADLNRARERARAASAPVTVTFDIDQGDYSIDAVAGNAVEVDLNNAPYNVKLTISGFDNSDAVTFNAFGFPDHPGSITLSAGGNSLFIELYANGETKR